MSRPKDCIFCGENTGSKEHTFPAALGGRRWNKGILCGDCNGGFSSLDAALASQLEGIAGLIGVRPDHSDEPVLTRVAFEDTEILLDGQGRPRLSAARVFASEENPDGGHTISVEAANKHQLEEWISRRRQEGIVLTQAQEPIETIRYVVPTPRLEWSFGGDEAYREIGRIALNFLASQWPLLARVEELRPFKDYVIGARQNGTDGARYVWYAEPESFELPRSPFEFGHQIALRLDQGSGEAYARVRFFDSYDLFVWFGNIGAAESASILFNIDPLANSASPDVDIQIAMPDISLFPAAVTPPTKDPDPKIADQHRWQIAVLLERIYTRHWRLNTEGLVDSINSARGLEFQDRWDEVCKLLTPHAGRVIVLFQYVLGKLIDGSKTTEQVAFFEAMGKYFAADEQAVDGLSEPLRILVGDGVRLLGGIIAAEIGTAPTDDHRLRLLLKGGPGAAQIGGLAFDGFWTSLNR